MFMFVTVSAASSFSMTVAMFMAVSVTMTMAVSVTVTSSSMIMSAWVASMWLVNTFDAIHCFSSWVGTWHWEVTKYNQVPDVASKTDERSDQHDWSVNLDLIKIQDSVSCLICEPEYHQPDDEDTSHSSKNLGSVISKWLAWAWCFLSNPNREHTNYKTSNIRAHMSSIS